MRHHNVVRKFGRKTGPRKAFLRSLAKNLLTHGKIVTTETRAKELRPFIEKLVTKGKDESITSKRLISARLDSSVLAKKMVEEISKKYKERRGGYTRIIKLGRRQGDASPMALIEFV